MDPSAVTLVDLARQEPAQSGRLLARRDELLDRAVVGSTTVGNRLAWVQLLKERLASDAVDLAGTLSRTENLDLVTAILEFQQMQLAYERPLASGAEVLQTSRLDFLQ